MTAGTCAICDAGTEAGDRHCPECGADLDAAVVEIGRLGEPSPPVGDRLAGRPRLAAIGACVVLVAAATWFLSASPRPDGDAAPGRSAGAAATEPPPTPTEGRDAAGGNPATARPTGAASAEPIDPTLLPDLAASHLAVAGGTTLHLLDLHTGTWTGRRLQNTPSAVYGVAGGVVMAGLAGGRVAFAPADGGAPVALGGSGSELLRIDDDGVIVRRWTAGPSRILSIAFDGGIRWRFDTPPGTTLVGVTAGGEVLMEAAQQVVTVDPFTGAARPIADARRERADETPLGRPDTATDADGMAVALEDSALVFRSGDGSVAATVASPVPHGPARLALIPAGSGR